jgi:hypothetical protein
LSGIQVEVTVLEKAIKANLPQHNHLKAAPQGYTGGGAVTMKEMFFSPLRTLRTLRKD